MIFDCLYLALFPHIANISNSDIPIINCPAGSDHLMDVEHVKLDIDLCLRTDHLTIFAITGFADQTEQSKNFVLDKVCPLIYGLNPLPLIYVICSTC